jgi:glycosyltransferase involved in cell wall biosynthesis
MKRCLVIPGPFVPYNDTITMLVYKHLRLLDLTYDVCALGNPADPGLERMLKQDPAYSKFNIQTVDAYNNVLFSIKNVDLFKGLRHMKRYVEKAVSMYNGQDLIYTNSWPCYTVRPALTLKKAHPNVRWIASFSDPINHSPYKYDQETYRSYSLPEKVCFHLYCRYYVVDQDEADAFEHADLLVFICPEQRDFMIEQYMKYFHQISETEIRKKCVLVPLNYIPEWNQLIPRQKAPRKSGDPFVLSHFGRVYGYRLTAEFIQAVRLFCEKYPDFPLRIEQYGEFRKSDRKLIHQLHLDSIFQIHDKIPYDACIAKMKDADAVLLFDTILPEDEIQPYLPSKILEYSLLEKDVLAVTTPKSPSYRIMKQTNAIACRYERSDIEQGLEALLIQHQPSKIHYAADNETAVQDLSNRIQQLYKGDMHA